MIDKKKIVLSNYNLIKEQVVQSDSHESYQIM